MKPSAALQSLLLLASGGWPAWGADGAALFAQNCRVCHQAGGVGVAGQFPRLAGRVAVVGSRPEGRTYLIDVLHHGLAGRIVVDGEIIVGLMPAFAQLPDADVAAVLNYVVTLGAPASAHPVPFTAEELSRTRAAEGPLAGDAQAERRALQARHLIE